MDSRTHCNRNGEQMDSKSGRAETRGVAERDEKLENVYTTNARCPYILYTYLV